MLANRQVLQSRIQLSLCLTAINSLLAVCLPILILCTIDYLLLLHRPMSRKYIGYTFALHLVV